MAVALSDPDLHSFTGGAPLTPQALRSRYERLIAGSLDPAISWCNWVIRLRGPDCLVGPECLVGTVQATIGPDAGGLVAEIAWVVGPPWQRRGIATEAARALIGWLEHRSVPTVIAHIHPDHQASAAVAAAAGLAPADHWQEGEREWRLTLTGRPGGPVPGSAGRAGRCPGTR